MEPSTKKMAFRMCTSPFLLLETWMTNLAGAGAALFSKGPAAEAKRAKGAAALKIAPATIGKKKKPNPSALETVPEKLLEAPQRPPLHHSPGSVWRVSRCGIPRMGQRSPCNSKGAPIDKKPEQGHFLTACF